MAHPTGMANAAPFGQKRSRGSSGEDATVTHNYGGNHEIKRIGANQAVRTLSPHGVKRRPIDQDLDYHRATKQLRRLGFEHQPEGIGGGQLMGSEGERLPDLDYSIQNQGLKQMHMEYLRQRSSRGLAPLEPQDVSSDDDDMCP